MTTLIDTVKPTEAYLEEILPQALVDRKEEEFVTLYLENMFKRISTNAGLYHLYGPWWPALKTMLLTRGLTDLGQIVDSDVAQIYQMSRPALTILAAQLYADERFASNSVNNPVHMLETASYANDTEPYIYTSYDESLEKFKLMGA
ncbi:olxA (plasmid) [Enterobacter sp. JBIWA008]|uniref:olxA n=1 Tax=Enterobacter TaxID=547 RepID=UPI000F84BA2D|nr:MULTISPECIES: olxA [Enterobacter]MCM7910268.1 olxA [Enterobacter hormaechei]HEW9972625.1 olxA [Enterobacter cloacae]MBA7754778.1 olxA [Enterobacter sp. RHBSTW-01064]RTM58796.1 olxA [Enterobacter hormaechei subsp. xiangfangensis]UAN43364.1 olxA [Enterobacter sp. JBIWA008]